MGVTAERFNQGMTYEEYKAQMNRNRERFDETEAAVELNPADVGAFKSLPKPLNVLVIAEDWCGDASNTIPIVARLAELTPGLEMRIVRRDQHPELMDQYLTNGSRSIPIVIVLDAELREIGHWGPRPAVLQSWVMANRLTTPKSELYPQVRKWYARDHGETTLREVLETAGFPVARVA